MHTYIHACIYIYIYILLLRHISFVSELREVYVQLSIAQVGEEISAASFESLAIVPSNATKFDAKEMSLSDFSTLAQSQGAYVNIKK